MHSESTKAHQMTLFGANQQITDIDVALAVDQAHRLRAVALAAHIQAAIDFMRRQHLAFATKRTLNSLSDHILRDIGIERSEIPGIARRLARGEAAAPSVVTPAVASAVVLEIATKDSDEAQQDLPLAA